MGWTLQEPCSSSGLSHVPTAPSEKVVSVEVCAPEGVGWELLKLHRLEPVSLSRSDRCYKTSFQ